MTELCGRKLDSLRTPTPVKKATGKGRRDIDDELEQHDVRASRKVAGTGASSTGPSIIITVCNDRRVSRGDLAAQAPGRPENVVCPAGHGLGSRGTDQPGRHDSQAMQRREAIAERTGLQRSRVTRHCQTLAGSGIVARAGGTAMDQTMVGAGRTARVDGRIIKSRDDAD